jgi:Protein of unknown function (DUF2637)
MTTISARYPERSPGGDSMDGMAGHTLLNGHRAEDGAAAVPVVEPFATPPVLQPRHQGPASPWPQQVQAATPQPARQPVDADKVIRVLTAVVVFAVAVFAAVVSYSHIYDLGRLHGQDGTAARLLPLSVDGLIAAASLVMLYAARNGIPMGKLSWPRAMLALGVGATIAANVGYGLPFGAVGALLSAWPAVAFIGSVEMAVKLVRDAHGGATGPATEPARGKARDAGRGSDGDSGKKLAPKAARQRRPAPSAADEVRRAMRQHPGLGKKELAAKAGVSVRTVERVLGEARDTTAA